MCACVCLCVCVCVCVCGLVVVAVGCGLWLWVLLWAYGIDVLVFVWGVCVCVGPWALLAVEAANFHCLSLCVCVLCWTCCAQTVVRRLATPDMGNPALNPFIEKWGDGVEPTENSSSTQSREFLYQPPVPTANDVVIPVTKPAGV